LLLQAAKINRVLFEMLLGFLDKSSEIYKQIEKLKKLGKDAASYDMKHYAMRARYIPWRNLNFGTDLLDQLRDLPKNLKIIVLQHVDGRLYGGVIQKTLPVPVQASAKKKESVVETKDPGYKSAISWIPADQEVLSIIKQRGYCREAMSAVASYLAPLLSFFNGGNI
jgi:hypothetical protein